MQTPPHISNKTLHETHLNFILQSNWLKNNPLCLGRQHPELFQLIYDIQNDDTLKFLSRIIQKQKDPHRPLYLSFYNTLAKKIRSHKQHNILKGYAAGLENISVKTDGGTIRYTIIRK